MQENVIDIIISIFRKITAGEKIKDIKHDDFAKFEKGEFIAAYSYVLENQPVKKSSMGVVPRILHIAERLVISTEAYGFLLELLKLGVLSIADMEYIIEKTMLNSSERVSLTTMKSLVAKHLFQAKQGLTGENYNLSGNELIN